MIINKFKSILRLPSFACLISCLVVNAPISAEQNTLLELTKQVSELEDILFKPGQNQLAVLLSLNTTADFKLDSVSFYIDNKKTTTYLYTKRESQALLKNAIQKIYVGDLSEGRHIIKAQFSALGKNTKRYKISSSSRFIKTSTTKYVELNISKSVQQELPVLNIKFWE